MEKYKKKLKEYFKKIYTHKGRNIYDVEHSIKRFRERFPELGMTDYYQVLENGIDTIFDVFNDSRGKYIIKSKSLRVGIQLEWRQDKKINNRSNSGFTATTLDIDKHEKEIRGDTQLFVEEIKKGNLENCFHPVTDYDKMVEDIGYMGIQIVECPDYQVYVKEGKLYKNFELIEVD